MMAKFDDAQIAQIGSLIEQHGVTRQLSPGQKWDVARIFGGILILATALAALGIWQALESVARDSARAVVIADAVAVLREDRDFLNRAMAAAPSLPSGVVFAFAPTAPKRECPAGFSPYESAIGRFIVGAGTAEGLTPKTLGETGGEEMVTLTMKQLPAHAHRLKRFYAYDFSSGPNTLVLTGESRPVEAREASKLTFGRDSRAELKATDAAGGGQPHDNMPPYIALYFCKKD